MDANPLATFASRLPLFFTLIVFWICPGIACIAVSFPESLATLDTAKLVLFAIALPAPLIAINYTWCFLFRPAVFRARYQVTAPVIVSGAMAYLVAAKVFLNGGTHAGLAAFYKQTATWSVYIAAGYVLVSGAVRVILACLQKNRKAGKGDSRKGTGHAEPK